MKNTNQPLLTQADIEFLRWYANRSWVRRAYDSVRMALKKI